MTAPDVASIAVLFLDMDGVVLSGRELWRTGNNRHVPPEKIALIKQVCDQTGAAVVVSSTWRYSDETADILRFHGIPLHPDWRTPFGRQMAGSLILATTRGSEISKWLARHPEVERYAIVDDDGDMLPEQRPYFVQTPFETGIDQSHADRLAHILRSERDA